jgi:outer membrane lipopolysaccharide assembly protein LptE/RlpB
MMYRQSIVIWLGLAVILLATACGYRFAGSGQPPPGVEKIFIELLENKTLETGIEVLITEDLKNEFIRKYQGTLTKREAADAVLSGVVTGVRTWTVSRQSVLSPLERRISMTIDLVLNDPDQATIRAAKGISVNETYAVVSGDTQATRRNKQEALETLSQLIAETSFNRLFSDF